MGGAQALDALASMTPAKRFTIAIVSAASVLVLCAAACFADATRERPPAATSPAHQTAVQPRTIQGRIVAVRRVSREITVQTAQGKVQEVKVPDDASITAHSGSHFSSVRSGENVHVTAIYDPDRGLIARSVSIP